MPTLPLTSGLHEVDGARYAHRLAETKGIALLRDDPPRIEAGQVRGLCARVSRRVSGHPRMIEVAVGVARRGQDALEKAHERLDGDLEAKLSEMMSTGLALVGVEGRRLLSFLPLFPAGNFMPEAMRAVASAADQPVDPSGSEAPPRVSLWKRIINFLRRRSRPATPVEPGDDANDGTDSATAGETSGWVDEGIRQLERGGFLDRDQRLGVYSFHETLQDHATRMSGLAPERASAGFVGLLLFYAGYLRDNSDHYNALDRCLGNALSLMETAWSARQASRPMDAVLASMVDALGYIFLRRGLWQLRGTLE